MTVQELVKSMASLSLLEVKIQSLTEEDLIPYLNKLFKYEMWTYTRNEGTEAYTFDISKEEQATSKIGSKVLPTNRT